MAIHQNRPSSKTMSSDDGGPAASSIAPATRNASDTVASFARYARQVRILTATAIVLVLMIAGIGASLLRASSARMSAAATAQRRETPRADPVPTVEPPPSA